MSSHRRDLWIKCTCGRRLAIVTWPDRNTSETLGLGHLTQVNDPLAVPGVGGLALRVDAAPNVAMRMHRTSEDEATYTWTCRCGETHTRRHTWVDDAWNGTAGTGKIRAARRVVTVTESL